MTTAISRVGLAQGGLVMKDAPLYDEGTVLGLLDPNARRALSRVWSRRSVPMGQLILAAEEAGGDVGFLIQGSARAATYTREGRQITFVELGTGDCFGEFAAIDGGARSAAVVATSDCVVGTVSSPQFIALLDNTNGNAQALINKLNQMTSKLMNERRAAVETSPLARAG